MARLKGKVELVEASPLALPNQGQGAKPALAWTEQQRAAATDEAPYPADL
jgi:hypothetical protein